MQSHPVGHIITRRRLYALGATVAVAAILFSIPYLAASQDEDTPAEAAAPQAVGVTVAQPTTQIVTEWDEFTGRFEAIDDVQVHSRVSGYLETVAFEDGALVEKGDLLFRIDPRPFQAELTAAEAERAGAAAALQNAEAEAARAQRLLEQSALSQEEAGRRTRDLRQAEAALAAAEARVERAKLDLEFSEIRAPVSGRISDNFVSEGNLIVGGAQGGTLLTTIVSMDPIYFEFTASEADYLKYVRHAEEGGQAGLQNAAIPVHVKLADETAFAHQGELSFVDNHLDRSTGTMRGRATFSNPGHVFAPGMFGRLRLPASGEREAILIPDSAVQTDQGEKFVWIAGESDIAERRPVELGDLHEGLRVVRAGLEQDDRVIVGGTQFVSAGAPVAPQAEEKRLAANETHSANR